MSSIVRLATDVRIGTIADTPSAETTDLRCRLAYRLVAFDPEQIGDTVLGPVQIALS